MFSVAAGVFPCAADLDKMRPGVRSDEDLFNELAEVVLVRFALKLKQFHRSKAWVLLVDRQTLAPRLVSCLKKPEVRHRLKKVVDGVIYGKGFEGGVTFGVWDDPNGVCISASRGDDYDEDDNDDDGEEKSN